MMRQSRWALLSILLSFGALSGCSPDKKAALMQSVELAALNEAASAYWDALRWGNAGDAGRYIADANQRLSFLKAHVSGLGFRITDKTVLEVNVSPALPEPLENGALRQGRVVVRIEGYTVPDSRLESKVLAQKWDRLANGWYLDVEQSEPLWINGED
jgi:hypothetical protein